jgi:CBS domain-containing membrane protein
MRTFLSRFLPELTPVSTRERLRSAAGALVGILATGLVCRASVPAEALPILIAPMGASAVLLFAVPASPLAQPWSILGGNLVAALVGVTAGTWIADPFVAASCAIGVAIALMMLLRCLHPPSGAVALTAVRGGPALHTAGYAFAVWPVGLNSLLLLGAALLFNNATGRRYPHLAAGPPMPSRAPEPPGAVSARDVEAVLRRHNEVFDIDQEDLLDLVQETETEALGRSKVWPTCGELMRPASTLSPDAGIDDALARLSEGAQRAVMVTDANGRLRGVINQETVLRHLRATRAGRATARLFQRSIRIDLAPRTVADIMEPPNVALALDTTVAAAASLFARHRLSVLPVMDAQGALAGVVDGSTVIAVLVRARSDLRLSA